MTKRTSKAAGIVPAAEAAAAVAAVVAADASVETEGERPDDDAGATGTANQADASSDERLMTDKSGTEDAGDGQDNQASAEPGNLIWPGLDFTLFDPADPQVRLALGAIAQIARADSVDEAFAAVLDAAKLIRPMVGEADFVEIASVEEPGMPASHVLDPADLAGRVLQVRAVVSGGRRRAGIAFGSEPQPVNVDDLSGEQLAAILSDDHLAVQVTD